MINSLKKKNVCEYIGIVPKPIENSTIKYLYKFDLFCARYYQIDITVKEITLTICQCHDYLNHSITDI